MGIDNIITIDDNTIGDNTIGDNTIGDNTIGETTTKIQKCVGCKRCCRTFPQILLCTINLWYCCFFDNFCCYPYNFCYVLRHTNYPAYVAFVGWITFFLTLILTILTLLFDIFYFVVATIISIIILISYLMINCIRNRSCDKADKEFSTTFEIYKMCCCISDRGIEREVNMIRENETCLCGCCRRSCKDPCVAEEDEEYAGVLNAICCPILTCVPVSSNDYIYGAWCSCCGMCFYRSNRVFNV